MLGDLVAHAREACPRECCGLLIGTSGRIIEGRRARNLAESPTRFLLDAQAHVEARRDSRRRGLDVVGFYHSHPATPAVPSATDLAEAWPDEHCHVIVSLATPVPETRLYVLYDGRFRELRLETFEASGGSSQSQG